MLIPDKLATACAIAGENNPGETGEFLLNLVAKLYDESIEEAVNKNYPFHLLAPFPIFVTIGFVGGEIDQHEIEEFLKRCQPVLNVTKIIADWGHSEMVHVHQHQTFSVNASNNLLDLCSKLY